MDCVLTFGCCLKIGTTQALLRTTARDDDVRKKWRCGMDGRQHESCRVLGQSTNCSDWGDPNLYVLCKSKGPYYQEPMGVKTVLPNEVPSMTHYTDTEEKL